MNQTKQIRKQGSIGFLESRAKQVLTPMSTGADVCSPSREGGENLSRTQKVDSKQRRNRTMRNNLLQTDRSNDYTSP